MFPSLSRTENKILSALVDNILTGNLPPKLKNTYPVLGIDRKCYRQQQTRKEFSLFKFFKKDEIIAMATQGAALQNHNNELVKCIEDLRDKRGEIDRQMKEDEQEKKKIQNDIQVCSTCNFHSKRL